MIRQVAGRLLACAMVSMFIAGVAYGTAWSGGPVLAVVLMFTPVWSMAMWGAWDW